MAKGKEFSYSEYYKNKVRKDLKSLELETLKRIKEIEKNLEKGSREIVKEIEEVERKPRKMLIVVGSLVLISLIFLGIWYFTKPTAEAKFSPLDASVSESTASSSIYYQDMNILGVSGWETKLNYNDKEDRLFGKETYKEIIFDDTGKAYTAISTSEGVIVEMLSSNPEKVTKVGWFTTPEQIEISEQENLGEKQVFVDLDSGDLKSEINYSFFRNKPYFYAQFSAQAENSTDLGEFAYDLVLSGYEIYLPNSTILENDNEIVNLEEQVDIIFRGEGNISEGLKERVSEKVDINRKTVKRTGSNYDIKDADYQLFYNPEKKLGVIVYSPDVLSFKNSFYWNVFWVYVPHLGNGKYPPIYVIVVENPNLIYDGEKGDWMIESKQYNGYAWDYIHDVIWEIENGEAGKLHFNDYFNINKIKEIFR